jgi:ribose 5-phosphate isomerase B
MEQLKRVHLGCDHRGFDLKQQVAAFFCEQGYTIVDHGCASTDSVDYPGIATATAQAAISADELAVVICGSGMGVSIAANKVAGARCAVVWCEAVAEFAKRHNHANVLAFSADLQTFTLIQRCLKLFLNAEYEGGRHQRRLDQITSFEEDQVR